MVPGDFSLESVEPARGSFLDLRLFQNNRRPVVQAFVLSENVSRTEEFFNDY